MKDISNAIFQSSKNEWTTLDQVESVQVRKVSDGLFMMRRGEDGTAIAVTAAQVDQMLARITRISRH